MVWGHAAGTWLGIALLLGTGCAVSREDPAGTVDGGEAVPAGTEDASVSLEPDAGMLDAATPVVPPTQDAGSPVVPDSGSMDAAVARDAAPPVEPVDAGAPVEEDSATLRSVQLPTTMRCGSWANGSVVMQNTGSAAWTTPTGHSLGLLLPNDPFSLTGVARFTVGEELPVPAGATHAFRFTLSAPTTPGTYSTRMQMVHELVRWFGPTVDQEIEVVEPCVPPPTCTSQPSQFHDDVEAALDLLQVAQPQLFGEENFHGRKVLDTRAYVYGVTDQLGVMGLHAVVDAWAGDEIAVRGTEQFSENFDILTSENYVRRGTGAYTATCTPPAF